MPMHPFALLVKPVGGACNLDCTYCFYKKHAPGVMAPEVFGSMIDSYRALPFAQKSVTLQGGEPLLANPPVFEILNTAPVQRAIQTNATRITEDLAAMFARHHWLVGVSLDGPRERNRNRRFGRRGEAPDDSRAEREAFDATVRGIRLLEKAGVDYNLLTVVSRANVTHAAETYRYLRDNFSTRFHQYIECTGPCEEITGEEWGKFLIELFDEWYRRDTRTVSIRLFDSIVSSLVRGYPSQCSFAKTCRQYLTVEYDGSVYPCDFFVRPELCLGNVTTHSWEELFHAPIFRSFAARKRETQPTACRTCAFKDFCNGDCPRNRQTLCIGWKAFFRHALPRLTELAASL